MQHAITASRFLGRALEILTGARQNKTKQQTTLLCLFSSVKCDRTVIKMDLRKFSVLVLLFFGNWVHDSDSDDSDEDIALLSVALYLDGQPPAKRRRLLGRNIWIHDMNKVRKREGEFHTGHVRLIETDGTTDDRFFSYYRMSHAQFEEVHSLIKDRIYKQSTNYRESVCTRERLAVTLR